MRRPAAAAAAAESTETETAAESRVEKESLDAEEPDTFVLQPGMTIVKDERGVRVAFDTEEGSD